MTPENLSSFGQFISTVGFPTAIALILLLVILWLFIKCLDRLEQSLDRRLGNLNKTLVMVVRVLNQINDHNNKDIVDIYFPSFAGLTCDKFFYLIIYYPVRFE